MLPSGQSSTAIVCLILTSCAAAAVAVTVSPDFTPVTKAVGRGRSSVIGHTVGTGIAAGCILDGYIAFVTTTDLVLTQTANRTQLLFPIPWHTPSAEAMYFCFTHAHTIYFASSLSMVYGFVLPTSAEPTKQLKWLPTVDLSAQIPANDMGAASVDTARGFVYFSSLHSVLQFTLPDLVYVQSVTLPGGPNDDTWYVYVSSEIRDGRSPPPPASDDAGGVYPQTRMFALTTNFTDSRLIEIVPVDPLQPSGALTTSQSIQFINSQPAFAVAAVDSSGDPPRASDSDGGAATDSNRVSSQPRLGVLSGNRVWSVDAGLTAAAGDATGFVVTGSVDSNSVLHELGCFSGRIGYALSDFQQLYRWRVYDTASASLIGEISRSEWQPLALPHCCVVDTPNRMVYLAGAFYRVSNNQTLDGWMSLALVPDSDGSSSGMERRTALIVGLTAVGVLLCGVGIAVWCRRDQQRRSQPVLSAAPSATPTYDRFLDPSASSS